MFGDERASAKEIGKFLLGVASMSGLSGFRDNESADHVRLCSHPSSDSCKSLTIGSPATHQILAQLATRILRHGDGVHVRTCRDAPPHP